MERCDTLILAGWLIDGSGGPICKDMCMAVRNGRIEQLRKLENADREHPEVKDFSGCTLLPHLVDSHVHLFMSGSQDPWIRERQLTSDYNHARELIAAHRQSHVRHGVMAVRDGGDRSAHSLRYALETGSSPGPVLCTAGNAWRQKGRYGSLIGRTPPEGMTLAGAIGTENPGADHVKIVNSGLNSLTSFGKTTRPQFTLAELKPAVRAAARQGLPVMVHANGAVPVDIAVEAGCRSIEHGFFMGPENLAKLVERQVFWVPTAVTMKAYSEMLSPGDPGREGALRNLEHQLEQLRLAHGMGVRVATGSDAGSPGVYHGQGVVEEMKLLVDAGFSLSEAVQCASVNGAELLNLKTNGILASGQTADFIVVNGSPEGLFDQLRHSARVWKQGASV
ncbi:Aryldialkylphosphatase related protein [Olavius algarvensis associated proteobacterium Delta 3]|nr:Aryldialkylphosphatase related protein [Olavius algarvensis associated proteobacterium Delta 3]CAB5140253.1 hypothetical protein D3OALGB2SA_4195 [Olavius algarvensis associated proteobacterium Delta 3]